MAMAELVGVGTKAISDYEVSRTEPAFDMIEKIANALESLPPPCSESERGFIPAGPRGKALHRINATLSRLNDAQLTRATLRFAGRSKGLKDSRTTIQSAETEDRAAAAHSWRFKSVHSKLIS